jgi:hypothetical protein
MSEVRQDKSWGDGHETNGGESPKPLMLASPAFNAPDIPLQPSRFPSMPTHFPSKTPTNKLSRYEKNEGR